jgi:two-component system, OmpR family, response regulator RegX3
MTCGKEAILVISQAGSAARSLTKMLEHEGYRCLMVDNVVSALLEVEHITPSVVIIDRSQHGIGQLREHHAVRTVPFMALCQSVANHTEEDYIDDLERGFDVVTCNPSARELLARVRAILRRQPSQPSPSPHYGVGRLRMDLDRHEVTVHGKLVDLTPKEFQILRQFLESPSRVFTREEMLHRVWGEGYALQEHALDVHIHCLREKIEANPAKPTYLVTVWGVGYKLQVD